MPIPAAQVYTKLLYANAETQAGLALRSLQEKEFPQAWLLLIALDHGQYGVCLLYTSRCV